MNSNVVNSVLGVCKLFPYGVGTNIFTFYAQKAVHIAVGLSRRATQTGSFVALLPGAFVRVRRISRSTRIYFITFSSHFLRDVGFVQAVSGLVIAVVRGPMIPLSNGTTTVCGSFFSLLMQTSGTPSSVLFASDLGPILSLLVRKIIGVCEEFGA